MWLGLIMAYNVWFVIWPNQKKALGIVECNPEEKAGSAKTASYFQEQHPSISTNVTIDGSSSKLY